MRTIRIQDVPRGTLSCEKNAKKAWLSENFGARAPVRKSSIFSTVPQKRFSAIGPNHVVFFGAGAPVVVRRRCKWCCSRRLYSAELRVSSLICTNGENSLKQQSLPAPIIQYFSYAVKYYLQIVANLSKLSQSLTSWGGCDIIYENLGQLGQIVLDTLRSCAAPRN